MIALEVIKSFELLAVITFAVTPSAQNSCHKTIDDIAIATACRRLVDSGSLVVGQRLPLIEVVEIIKELGSTREGVCTTSSISHNKNRTGCL